MPLRTTSGGWEAIPYIPFWSPSFNNVIPVHTLVGTHNIGKHDRRNAYLGITKKLVVASYRSLYRASITAVTKSEFAPYRARLLFAKQLKTFLTLSFRFSATPTQIGKRVFGMLCNNVFWAGLGEIQHGEFFFGIGHIVEAFNAAL